MEERDSSILIFNNFYLMSKKSKGKETNLHPVLEEFKGYTPLPPPKGEEIYYLKCKRIPRLYDDLNVKLSSLNLRKGTPTWVRKSRFYPNGGKVHIEDNRHCININSSDFRVVDSKGNTIPVEEIPEYSKYEFETKAMLIYRNSWDFGKGLPKGIEDKKILDLLGKKIDNKFNVNIENPSDDGDFVVEDVKFSSTNLLRTNHPYDREDKSILDFVKNLEESYEKIKCGYRIKFRKEFNKSGLWHEGLNTVVGWGDIEEISEHLLGAIIPEEFTEKCEKGESFKLGDILVKPEYYLPISGDVVDRNYLENIHKVNTVKCKFSYYEDSSSSSKSEESEGHERESLEIMKSVLESIYEDDTLRKSSIPLFIGNPGLGKTKIIEQFAKEKGAKLVELITSQMSPFEISGIAMPDKETKKMTYYNFDKLESLEDGDIVFFDELLNGNPVVLNACLTVLEQRRLISGKPLPNIMIVAAANPQGMVPLTPQIKERFIWYNLEFSPRMWSSYMKNKYSLPESILQPLCSLIKEEEFTNNNFYTPRSVDKAVNMIIKNCPTPYEDVIKPILGKIVYNNTFEEIKLLDKTLSPGESTSLLDFLRKTEISERA